VPKGSASVRLSEGALRIEA